MRRILFAVIRLTLRGSHRGTQRARGHITLTSLYGADAPCNLRLRIVKAFYVIDIGRFGIFCCHSVCSCESCK